MSRNGLKKNLVLIIFLLISFFLFSNNKTISSEDTSSETIIKLIEELGDSDFLTNYYAGRKILKMGKEAVPYLIKALDHDNGRIRLASIILLEQMKDKRAIPEFMRVFKEKNRKERERTAVALALGRMEAKEALDLLIEGLSENSTTIKSACIMSLGMLKEEKAVPYLIKFVKDKEESISKISMRALQSIGDKGIPEIEKLIDKGSFEEKLISLEILGNIKSEKSVEVLKKVLRNDNKYLAISSAYILSTIGEKEGKEIAINLMKDKDPKIRELAVRTLENIEKLGVQK